MNQKQKQSGAIFTTLERPHCPRHGCGESHSTFAEGSHRGEIEMIIVVVNVKRPPGKNAISPAIRQEPNIATFFVSNNRAFEAHLEGSF